MNRKLGVGPKIFSAAKELGKYGDLTSKRFNALTVIKQNRRDLNMVYWDCECDCGTKLVLNEIKLTSGSGISCGCMNKTEFKASQKAAATKIKRNETEKASKHKADLDLAISNIKLDANSSIVSMQKEIVDIKLDAKTSVAKLEAKIADKKVEMKRSILKLRSKFNE